MLGVLKGACFSIQLFVIDVARMFGSQGEKKGEEGEGGGGAKSIHEDTIRVFLSENLNLTITSCLSVRYQVIDA